MTSRTGARAEAVVDVLRVAWPAAASVAVVLLATASRYGLHGDELYFRMLPVAWWYDDQPPLVVWLSHLAARAGDQVWVQRLPAVLAASTGALVAAATARAVGAPTTAQRTAAWAHATTVYPLLVGHVFLTSSIDLLVWQVVVLLVLRAVTGYPRALAWAGLVAGLGCWDKLLVVVLAVALTVALALWDARLLTTRWAALGVVAAVLTGGVQVGAQVVAGMPMTRVSADLVTVHGQVTRLQVLPLLVVFCGPPLAGVWWRGLAWRPHGAPRGAHDAAGLPVLATTAVLVTAWTLAVPSQPYYPVGAVLPALAAGWGAAHDAGTRVWRHRRAVVAANGAVAAVLCLPVVPEGSAAFRVVAAVNPVQRDQSGWGGYVRQVAAARPSAGTDVVTDSYALAGAVAHHGPAVGIAPGHVFSGHDALWSLGPPTTGPSEEVLLVGRRVVSQRRLFARCRDAGTLALTTADPFRVAGSPMAVCRGPVGGWARVWPAFRHLGA